VIEVELFGNSFQRSIEIASNQGAHCDKERTLRLPEQARQMETVWNLDRVQLRHVDAAAAARRGSAGLCRDD